MSADFCDWCDCEIVGQVYFNTFCSEECYESYVVHMDPPDEEVCGECGRHTPCGCVDEQEFPWDDVCDICYRSNVNADRTTYCGKTLGIECGCNDKHSDGVCNDINCEMCKKN